MNAPIATVTRLAGSLRGLVLRFREWLLTHEGERVLSIVEVEYETGAVKIRQPRFGIRPMFAWYDFWVGIFWDGKKKRLYVFPLPMIGVRIGYE